MKHILAIILFLVGFTVSAQVVDTGANVEFHLGEYVFESEWKLKETDEIIHSKFKKKDNKALKFEDITDENYALGRFMRENKDTLEKRFGILIEEIYYDWKDCYVRISRPEDIQAENARWEEAERRSKEIKEGRIKSLEEWL